MEPSRLGKALSDTTTRRVIIGVLGMLMFLPILTYSATDYSSEYGLRKLFWYGRSNCANVNGTFMCEKGNWITKAGWNQMLYEYIVAGRGIETDPLTRDLLWLYIPDFDKNGSMSEIEQVPDRFNSS
jgi:hypothetical protein